MKDNIDLIFDKWNIGVSDRARIRAHYEDRGASLKKLHSFLQEGFQDFEIVTLIRIDSPRLGANMLEYMTTVPNATKIIMKLIEKELYEG